MNAPLQPTHPIRRVRHEIQRRDVRVAATETIGPGFLRVTFTGEALADFVSLGFDDHVKFLFEDAGGVPVRRDFTPRYHDRTARTLAIEFALHERGAASDWARRAKIGQAAAIAGPKGSLIVSAGYDWHLLVGDASALPAIHNRIGELPAGRRAIAVIQVDPADRRELHGGAGLDVRWLSPGDDLLAAVRALQLPPGNGFAWAGGEAAVMRPLRELLVREKGLPAADVRVAAYWKQGAADFHERIED